jgi:hypothetical protein
VRIQAFRYTQPDDYRRQVAHAFVSPPEGAVRNEQDFYRWKGRAAEIAKEKGFRGFAVVPHPWRVTEEGKERYREEDPEYGVWVWLRNDVDGMDRYTYWSPHYHILGLTTPDMDVGDGSDGAVYHFKRSLSRFSGVRDTGSHEDVYGAFRYLLSHVGFPEESDRQAVSWHGDLANSVFVENATEDWQYQKPSEGVLSALERSVEGIAGVTTDDDSDGSEANLSDDEGECPVEGCDGRLIGVFDVPRYLEHNEVETAIRRRMVTAHEWAIGDRIPPPGLKHPQTEEQAREAYESLL